MQSKEQTLASLENTLINGICRHESEHPNERDLDCTVLAALTAGAVYKEQVEPLQKSLGRHKLMNTVLVFCILGLLLCMPAQKTEHPNIAEMAFSIAKTAILDAIPTLRMDISNVSKQEK